MCAVLSGAYAVWCPSCFCLLLLKFVVCLYVVLATSLFVIAVVLSGYRELVCGGVVTVL